MKYLFLLILLTWILIGCSEEDNITEPDNENEISIPINEIAGQIQLPKEMNYEIGKLRIIGTSESTLNNDSSFTVESIKDFYQYLYLVNENDKIIGMTYSDTDENIIINKTTTAIALIMSVSIPWETLGIERTQAIELIKNHPQFNELEDIVENLMINDPNGLLDFEAHPRIAQVAVQIISGIVENNHYLYKTSGNSAYLECDGKNLTIINPRNIAYGISGFDLNSNQYDKNNYLIWSKPFWIESKGLLGLLLGPSTRAYNLEDGKYLVILAKHHMSWFEFLLTTLNPAIGSVINFQDYFSYEIDSKIKSGNYLEAVKSNARYKGALGFSYEFVLNAVGLIPAKGDLIQLGGAIVEELINSEDSGTDLLLDLAGVSGKEGVFLLPKALAHTMATNKEAQKFLAKRLYKDARLTKGIRIAGENTSRWLVITDVAEMLLNIWGLLTGEQEIAYTITKSQNGITCVESLPPSIPTISVAPNPIPFSTAAKITLNSVDPENKKVKYFLRLQESDEEFQSEFISSGINYTFDVQPKNSGPLSFFAYSEDEDGSVSGSGIQEAFVLPDYINFYEGFENYGIGSFESPLWNIEYDLPSEVRISSIAAQGKQSAKFIDYDPALGEDEGKYAVMLTQFESAPDNISFFIRVDDKNDSFGIRAWGDLGDWSTMSFYILTWEGAISYSDGNDFYPLFNINKDMWYKISLDFNWNSFTYNLNINNEPIQNAIPFSNEISYTPNLQIVAFSDAQCRGAYIDEITFNGGGLPKKLTKGSGNDKNLKSRYLSRLKQNVK